MTLRPVDQTAVAGLSEVDNLRDLETRFALAVRQREVLEEYIRTRLKPEKHYYTISEGGKPGLTKEGAELICLPHGYKPMYMKEAGPDQPPEDDTPYQITVRCRLMLGDIFEGEGCGSASSHITKKGGARTVRQPDIGLRHNATLKMAQKSAYIAATLNATAASEFFTQDMEDAGASGTVDRATTGEEKAKTIEGIEAWVKGGKNDLGVCPEQQHKGESFFKTEAMREPAHKPEGGAWCNQSVVLGQRLEVALKEALKSAGIDPVADKQQIVNDIKSKNGAAWSGLKPLQKVQYILSIAPPATQGDAEEELVDPETGELLGEGGTGQQGAAGDDGRPYHELFLEYAAEAYDLSKEVAMNVLGVPTWLEWADQGGSLGSAKAKLDAQAKAAGTTP